MRRQFRFTFISRINTTKSSRQQQQQQQKLLDLFASRPYIHIAAASCLSVARSRSTSTSIYRYNLMIADIDFDTNDSEYVSLFYFFLSYFVLSSSLFYTPRICLLINCFIHYSYHAVGCWFGWARENCSLVVVRWRLVRFRLRRIIPKTTWSMLVRAEIDTSAALPSANKIIILYAMQIKRWCINFQTKLVYKYVKKCKNKNKSHTQTSR